MGGAAGRGLQDVYEHAKELPGAVADTVSGLVNNPKETLSGFMEGATQGAEDAGLAAAANAAMEYGGNLVMRGVGNAAKSVYRGYLKPSLAGHAIKDAQQIVDTALAEGLPITSKGVAKGNKVIDELKTHVNSILQARQNISKNLFGDIDLHDIAEKVRQFARDKYFKPGVPTEDFTAAMKVADNIDAHPSLNLPPGASPGPTPVDLEGANAVKQRLQNSVSDRGFGVERNAATEAEKKGQYELRQAIEQRAPVGPLNARESKLIDATKAIARAVEREANQNALVGVKTVLAAGAGGVEYGRTGDPYTAAAKALAIRMALTPTTASRMAIVAARLAKSVPGVAPASAARLAFAALQQGGDQGGDEQ